MSYYRLLRHPGGLAIVGPNCLGVTNNVDGIMLHMLFAREALRFGPDSKPGLAFVGQSGGTCVARTEQKRGDNAAANHALNLDVIAAERQRVFAPNDLFTVDGFL